MEMIHDILEPLMEADEDVIFFGISESMSTTCNVVRLMGNDFDKGRLFVIDSMSLSSGEGLQVLRAAELVKEGWSADQIVEKINNDRKLVRASFVVDTLTYLARGGRCSGAAALVAGAIKLHPCIKVCDGKMVVNKKYRGTLPRALKGYFDDLVPEMAHADKKRVFVTHSGVEEEVLSEMTRAVEELHYFDEVIVARAGGVISSHCGPGTLGVLYYMQEEE
jgi:DegV family protein with EDD domain